MGILYADKFIVLVLVTLLVLAGPARAACVNPSGNEGDQVYNSTYHTMQFCDGTTWWGMKGGGAGGGLANVSDCAEGDTIRFNSATSGIRCPDKTPDTLTFADQTDVAVSTMMNSDIVQVTGIETAVTISIAGDGSPEYRICTDSACSTEIQTWGDAEQAINNSAYLQLRLTSAATGGVMNSATVSVGSASDQWNVTTVFDGTPDAFAFTDATGVDPSMLTESNVTQIMGINVSVNISLTGDGSPEYRICADGTCSGTPPYTPSSGTINNGDYLQLRLTSNAAWETLNSTTIAVGDASDQWDVTTRADCTIVNGVRTCADCTGAGGALVTTGGPAGESMCKFSGGACPGGWSPYLSWTTTSRHGCSGTSSDGCPAGSSCSTGYHAFANAGRETCTPQNGYLQFTGHGNDTCRTTSGATCYASIAEVGCY